MCFTIHEWDNFKRNSLLIAVGAVGSLLLHKNFLITVGALFILLLSIDVISNLITLLLVPLIYSPISIMNVKELKHDERRYQFIVVMKGKEIYSHVYSEPLENVKITCWRINGKYKLLVRRRFVWFHTKDTR